MSRYNTLSLSCALFINKHTEKIDYVGKYPTFLDKCRLQR